MRRIAICAVLLGSTVCGLGCVELKPWEREQLARPDMAWQGDEVVSSQTEHIYFSKEASLPGGSAGGGGCGCN